MARSDNHTTTRVAGAMGVLAFAGCLLIGEFVAGNPFTTTVARALGAMAATFGVGLVVGWMGQRMLEEDVARRARKSEFSEADKDEGGR